MKYEVYFKNYLAIIEKKLDQALPKNGQHPPLIHEAMRYCVLNGGKRFRPVMVLAACEACGGKPDDALLPAVSLEFIHSSSLVHDDLPALDNDDTRRGKPTCHKKYGEAMAILVGDALLVMGQHVLAKVTPAQKALDLLDEISTSAGTYGMIGGQVADILAIPGELTLPKLDYINIHKTGKLIKASAVAGAISAGASKEIRARMLKYGECIGLAFQTVDDLLDGDGYMKIVKPKEVKQRIRDLIATAKREIRPLGKKAEKLQALADYLLKRIPRDSHVKVDR